MNRLDAMEKRAEAHDRYRGDTCADCERHGLARTDLPLLLAVARAARLVKAQCDDMCPSWYDEPCDHGIAALRAALAPLLEPEL